MLRNVLLRLEMCETDTWLVTNRIIIIINQSNASPYVCHSFIFVIFIFYCDGNIVYDFHYNILGNRR